MNERELLLEFGAQIAALQTVVMVLMSEHPNGEKLDATIREALVTQTDAARESGFVKGLPAPMLTGTETRWHFHVDRLLQLAQSQRGTPRPPA